MSLICTDGPGKQLVRHDDEDSLVAGNHQPGDWLMQSGSVSKSAGDHNGPARRRVAFDGFTWIVRVEKINQ